MGRLTVAASVVVFLLISAGTALAHDIVHVVGPGDNVSRIAQHYGVSIQAIVSANGLINPNLVYVGQRLLIPTGSYTPPTTPPSYPPVGTARYYAVQPGDTLSKIAARFNSTVPAIVALNRIPNPNVIYVGQVLGIPYVPVIYNYTVQRGDTLGAIARRYGTTVSAIASYNGLANPNRIFPGMLLRIPV